MPADSLKTDPALTTPTHPSPQTWPADWPVMNLGAKSTQNQQQYSQYQDYLARETRRLAKRRCQ